MKRLMFWVFAMLLATAFAGCNTIDGIGEDVEAVGEAVQSSVDDSDD